MEAHGQRVIDSFKKFDRDGNGCITRDELGAVLKSLDGEVWTDESIDRVLAMADTSGDGVLYFEEFVKWMLAADNEVLVSLSGTESGNFSFVVSGSSRPELDGEYVQQDRFYGHRPVFYCAENERMLFYQKENGAWQIYFKPSKLSSARLKTTRAPHMAEAQWTVWKKNSDGKGEFAEDPEMGCRQGPPLSPEERRAQAPDVLFFDSPTMRCEMKKTEKIMGGRNLYATDEGEGCMCLYIDGDKGFFGWAFFQSKEVQKIGEKGVTTSHPTSCYSPHLCLWKDEVSVQAADPKKILKPREAGSEPWTDPDFPPTMENMGKQLWEKKGSPGWTRLPEIFDNPKLFDEEDPFDIRQGGLGNCWLIAVLASLGEYQPYLRDHIFLTKDIAPDGRYQFRLYDIKVRDWVIVEVDDFVPCHQEKSPHHHDSPYFCKSRSMWPMLLEKVFAKLAGSYLNLKGGSGGQADFGSTQVMHMLTGGTVFHHFRRSNTEQSLWVTQRTREVTAGPETTSQKKGTLVAWAQIYEQESEGKRMKFKIAPGTATKEGFQPGTEEGWINTHQDGMSWVKLSISAGWTYTHYQLGPHKDWYDASSKYRTVLEKIEGIKNPEEEMWQKLVEIDKGSSIWDVSFTPKDSGLIAHHAYTLIHCIEVDGFKMLALRNPWGRTEWKGAWSDESEEWEAHPEVAKALKMKADDDGLFWMEFADFQSRACEICCCVAPEPLPRIAARLSG